MCTLHVTKVDINMVIYRKPQNITKHTHAHVCASLVNKYHVMYMHKYHVMYTCMYLQ
jgi:hypothetical protein